MADDAGQDVVNSITDPVKGAWKKVNDLADKIPSFGVKPAKTDDKSYPADPGLLKQANDSYLHNTQTKAQQKSSPPAPQGKTVIKTGPRKR